MFNLSLFEETTGEFEDMNLTAISATINKLPNEILLMIFDYLDEISLACISESCIRCVLNNC